MPPSVGTARDFWREDEPRHPALALPGIIGACGPCTERVDAGALPPREPRLTLARWQALALSGRGVVRLIRYAAALGFRWHATFLLVVVLLSP